MEIQEYEELYSILARMKPTFEGIENAMQEILAKFDIKRRQAKTFGGEETQ